MAQILHKYSIVGVVLLLLINSIATPPANAQENTPVTHLVQHGDSLYRIALRYGVTIDAIAKENQLTNYSRILVGQTLVIPGLSAPDSGDVIENPLVAGTPTYHTIQAGDTLEAIAQKYGISTADLLKANNITNPNLIYRGQKLTVWTTASVNSDAAPENTADDQVIDNAETHTAPAIRATHTVQRGETLARIAAQYGISWTDIAGFNNITNADRIYYGQELLIPSVNNATGASDLGIISDVQLSAQVPQPTITTGKLIMVDLSDSMVYAFQDGELVYSALGSMGLPATPTVTGEYKIYLRYRSQTMSGPGYYLPGVEWVQYFYQGYGLHGTYWHTNWGQPMSRGCVNLRNEDAEWLYHFGEIGTPVHVNY